MLPHFFFAFLHVYFNILNINLNLIVTTLEGSNTREDSELVKPNVGDVRRGESLPPLAERGEGEEDGGRAFL